MKTDIDVAMTYPHPAERVWAALTSSEALAAWFMPNDFSPAIGHRFSFRARPARALGFDGIVRCEVLELDPPKRMVWSWAGGSIDTTVTFTLEETAEGEPGCACARSASTASAASSRVRILAGGYPRILGQRLPAYLDQMTSLNVSPAPGQCAKGGRSYVGAFRRWRHIQSR